jgi:hypothetical protein
MWGSLFSSLDNGLGRSLKLLTTVDIAQMQKVCRQNDFVRHYIGDNTADAWTSLSMLAVFYFGLRLLYRNVRL